ncbi:anti-sigma-D factor RsdA [Actinomycetes bacterium KLBMP 9797]
MNSPEDLQAIAADDELLDALGRGEPAPADDPLAGALAAWRADLDDGAAAAAPASTATVIVQRPRRLARLVSSIAAGIILLSGLALVTYQADPSSPLWPVTRVVYPQQADVRAAEDAIAQARTEFAAGRTAAAERLLDQAAAHVANVDDPAVARRLAAEIATLRSQLAAAPDPSRTAPPATSPSVSPPPAGGTVSEAPPRSGESTPAPASPSPSPSRPGGLLPPLPSLLPLPPLFSPSS